MHSYQHQHRSQRTAINTGICQHVQLPTPISVTRHSYQHQLQSQCTAMNTIIIGQNVQLQTLICKHSTKLMCVNLHTGLPAPYQFKVHIIKHRCGLTCVPGSHSNFFFFKQVYSGNMHSSCTINIPHSFTISLSYLK